MNVNGYSNLNINHQMTKNNRQTSIASFFGKGPVKAGNKSKNKNRNTNAKAASAAKNMLVDTDDEVDVDTNTSGKTNIHTSNKCEAKDVPSPDGVMEIEKVVKSNKKKRTKKKLVIDDGSEDEVMNEGNKSDDEESTKDDGLDEVEEMTVMDDNEFVLDENEEDEDEFVADEDENGDDNNNLSVKVNASISKNKKRKSSEKSSSSKKKLQKDAFETLKSFASSSKASSTKNGKSDSKAVKSDEDLAKVAKERYNWDCTEIPNDVPYCAITSAFNQCEAITSRLAIQEIITTIILCAIKLLEGDDINKQSQISSLVYLCCNGVAPAYKCVELGVGESLLIGAIGEASGTLPKQIKEAFQKSGDLGEVASKFRGKQRTLSIFQRSKPKPLLAREVLKTFREIAKTTGNKSRKWKIDKIKGLLVKCQTGEEAKYIIRALSGKLRIGLAESTVLVSLAHSLILSGHNEDIRCNETKEKIKSNQYPATSKALVSAKEEVARLEAAVAIIKKAYSEHPSYDTLVMNALAYPLHELHKYCALTPGVPVAPMLAKPTKSVLEVLKRLSGKRFTAEYKYDGERAQIHLSTTGESRVFSRNLLCTTEKYPEAVHYAQEAATANVKSFVMDAEVVAFNRETGQLVPFQILSTRKKTAEDGDDNKPGQGGPNVKVIVQAFDLMYLNGESLLLKSFAERRALLYKYFKCVEGKFQFAVKIDHTEDGDSSVIEQFLDAAVKGQCEGLMIKTLDENADYEPSRRSLNWLKLKKDYLEGLGDSVDLVPLGAYYGKGKRTGVYGAYLLACYDVDTEEFQSVCKIGTGFSDEDLKILAERLNKHKIPEKSSQYNVSDQLGCDVWFDAVQVWEIKAADLSKSSAHRGAVDKTGESGRGIGLRFPRFERLRDDKYPEDATSSDQILEMYYAQDTVNGGNGVIDDDGI